MAMAKMDHSKMDMNDPVMKAMMAKCKNAMKPKHEEPHEDDSTEEEPEKHGAHH